MKTSETIIKYNKEKALKINCRKIKGEYYEKNKDCFFINNKWYRLNSGYIEFDHEKQEYVLKNENMIEGVVDFKDNKNVKGFFTPNIYENVTVKNISDSSDFSVITKILFEKKEAIRRLNYADFREGLKKTLFNYYHKIFYDSTLSLTRSSYTGVLFAKYSNYNNGAKIFKMLGSNTSFTTLDLIILLSQNGTSFYYRLLEQIGGEAAALINDKLEKDEVPSVGFRFNLERYEEIYNDNDQEEATGFLIGELENFTRVNNSIFTSIANLRPVIQQLNIEKIELELDGFILDMDAKVFFDKFPKTPDSFKTAIMHALANLNTYLLAELIKDNIALSSVCIDTDFFAQKGFHIESLDSLGIPASVALSKKYLEQLKKMNYMPYIEEYISHTPVRSNKLNAYFLFERRDFCKKANNNRNVTDFNYSAATMDIDFTEKDIVCIKEFEAFLNRQREYELSADGELRERFINHIDRFTNMALDPISVNDIIFEARNPTAVPTPSISEELKEKYNTIYPDSNTEASEDNLVFINSKVARKAGYSEIFGTEYFSKSTKAQYPKNGNYSKMNYNVSEEEGQESEIEKEIKTYNKNYQIQTLKELEKYEQLLGNKSFGIEYETSKGYIPKRYLYKTGLIPLRDGSLDGGIEYTSLPMSGSTGLQSVLNQCAALNKYCNINDKCSLHVHIGNVPRTKEFGLALYTLFTRIQNELFEIIPPYKRDLEWISRRGKDYCKPLRTLRFSPKSLIDKEGNLIKDKVNSAFSNLFLFLTENEPESKKYNFDTGLHPKHGAGKWNYKSRYYALNLINLYFSKYKTIEFRMHTPTLSQDKTLNWLFICVAIARYTEQNIVKILKGQEKIDLTEIIYGYYDNFSGTNQTIEQGKNLADHLLGYINQRKDEFNEYFIRQRVIDTSFSEIEGDKNYTFISEKLNWDKLNYNFNKNEQQKQDSWA